MDERQRWDERYRARGASGEPSRVLTDLAELLPRAGRALDLAGGAGRHARWLEARGLDVTLADLSPVALQLAREAGFRGATVEADLGDALPRGPWDLVLVFHFLDRAILRHVVGELAPGGILVIVHPTRRNLERHPRPSARWLLEEGELQGLVSGLRVLHAAEGWSVEGRHEAVVVAAAPPEAPRAG